MKTMKKAEAGSSFAKLAPPYNKATFADKIAGAKKNAGKAKSGTKIKKAMSGYGGKAASMVPMKNGGKMKKAQTGTVSKKFDRPDSKDTKPEVFSTSGVGKNVPAKNGKSMKKCKYGCK
jgi:hypothetical protein